MQQIELTEEETEMLERVRVKLSLETLDQAAEHLIRQRLRKAARQVTGGRGPALYVVKK